MDDLKHNNGEDEPDPFDLSRPLQGEPVPDAGANGNEPGEDADERAASPGESAGLPDGRGAEGDADPTKSEPSVTGSDSCLPLPLMHELEQEPPVKEPPPSPRGQPDTQPPAAEEESGRRLPEDWRIDLKWIFGIPATIVLILTIAAFAFFRVSGEEAGVSIIDETRQQMISDARFRQDVARVDPQLLDLLESDELAAMLYEDPELLQSLMEEIPEFEEDDPRAEQYDYVRTTLDVYSSLSGTTGENEHVESRSALIALVLLLALFGIPYIIFSRRLGKIVSVAASLAIASWIPLLLLIYLRGGLSDWIADRVDVEGDTRIQFIVNMVDTYAREFVDTTLPIYRFFSIIALIMLGFGLLGLLVVWWRFEESMTPRKKKLRGTGD